MDSLLLYRLLFMAELFTAEFLFILHLRKRKYFALRFAASVLTGFGLTFLFLLVEKLVPSYTPNAFYTSFTFLVLFACTVPMLAFCCDEPWINVFFCGIAAYTTQHFSYGVANFILSLIEWGRSPILGMYFGNAIDFTEFNLNTLFIALVYVFAYFCSYLLLYLAFGKRIKRGENFKVRSLSVLFLVVVALIVDILLNCIVVYYGNDDNIVTTLMSTVYENLCCFFLLYIQFGLIKRGTLENELVVTKSLLREIERQYKLSKESIDLINIKCHDLRHQIRVIGEGKGLSDEAVKEIENAISIYDAKVQTDNEVLDIILTEKSLKCTSEGIELTCVADGRALDFMEKTDLYALFGNALDNAIEAVMGLHAEQRSVGVVVRRVGEIVSVNIQNYFGGDIAFDGDGLPVTKGNRDFHGFGMKSIRRIATKYKGTLSVSTRENVFILNLLIPVPKSTEEDAKKHN